MTVAWNELRESYLWRRVSVDAPPSALVDYLRLHAAGRLDAALARGEQLLTETWPPDVADFLWGDVNLLRAKLGRKPDFSKSTLADPVADLILQYGLFTYYFWVDQKKAGLCLRRMLRTSLARARLDFVAMTLFLIAHLRAIANRRFFAEGAAGLIYRMTGFLRRRRILVSPFAHDIIVATFPYTNYVRAKFSRMRQVLATSREFLSDDPYYNCLYSLTALYHAAYSGNIVDTERMVATFKELQERGKLVRYRPVTTLMGLLPFCIRGYEHVVRDKFVAFMQAHANESHDVLVNSQVHRIAAVVYTTLGEFEKAGAAIDVAVKFRTETGFHSWTHVDRKIKKAIADRHDIDSIFEATGAGPSDRTAYLKSGFVISKLVEQLDQISGDVSRLAEQAAAVIAQHLDVDYTLDGADATALTTRLFGKRVDFVTQDPVKADRARGLLEILMPSVRSIESTALRLKAAQDKLKEQEKLAAIAATTQMLAHDVRRPFSILRMGLSMLGRARDPASVKGVLDMLVPEVERAVSSVDGLIADVMEVGSTSTQLLQEPASPGALIDTALRETFRVYPKADVSIRYDLTHRHMVKIDRLKVGRVLSNVISNAVQAIKQKGGLWLKTREHGGFVEFCIGNAGSYIPPEDLASLFDAFFTKGKRGGTGLGLAIAQKIVVAHGGSIWCESRKPSGETQGAVEFYFTLPIAEGHLSKTTSLLPTHSSEITTTLLTSADTIEATAGSVAQSELTLESEIVEASRKLRRPLRLLVVDDEPIYRNALAASLSRTPDLSAAIKVVQAETSAHAMSLAAHLGLDITITDIDLGPGSANGLDLVHEMRRAARSTALICVHSNRMCASDHKMAIETGADAFLPKPMARAHLLKLVLQAAEKANGAEGLGAPRPGSP